MLCQPPGKYQSGYSSVMAILYCYNKHEYHILQKLQRVLAITLTYYSNFKTQFTKHNSNEKEIKLAIT